MCASLLCSDGCSHICAVCVWSEPRIYVAGTNQWREGGGPGWLAGWLAGACVGCVYHVRACESLLVASHPRAFLHGRLARCVYAWVYVCGRVSVCPVALCVCGTWLEDGGVRMSLGGPAVKREAVGSGCRQMPSSQCMRGCDFIHVCVHGRDQVTHVLCLMSDTPCSWETERQPRDRKTAKGI